MPRGDKGAFFGSMRPAYPVTPAPGSDPKGGIEEGPMPTYLHATGVDGPEGIPLGSFLIIGRLDELFPFGQVLHRDRRVLPCPSDQVNSANRSFRRSRITAVSRMGLVGRASVGPRTKS